MNFLRRFRDPPPRPPLSPELAERDSILENLSRLLASQREYASFLPEFGLGETWHRPITPRTLEILRKEILALVGRYEDRLRGLELVILPRAADGALLFRLSGRLERGELLAFQIRLAPAQRGSVSLLPGAVA